MSRESRALWLRAALGAGCVAAGVVAGQMVDQRLMLVAMFPAVALLSGVISRLTAPRAPKTEDTEPPLSTDERYLLAAVWNSGGLRVSEASEETSLSEAEAARILSDLAGRGYLDVRESGGTEVYERAGRGSR